MGIGQCQWGFKFNLVSKNICIAYWSVLDQCRRCECRDNEENEDINHYSLIGRCSERRQMEDRIEWRHSKNFRALWTGRKEWLILLSTQAFFAWVAQGIRRRATPWYTASLKCTFMILTKCLTLLINRMYIMRCDTPSQHTGPAGTASVRVPSLLGCSHIFIITISTIYIIHSLSVSMSFRNIKQIVFPP